MARLRHLIRNQRGASAVEFALLAPVLFSIIIGAAQMGILFFANAGLQHAVGEGARLAMIFPRPSEQAVQDKVRASRYGLDPDYLVGDPVVTYTEAESGDYADISWSYKTPLNFIFFETRPVTLNHSRRAYLQDEAAAAPTGGGGGTTTGGSTTGGGTTTGAGTTTGGDASTSSTSGGDTSTSSTGGSSTTTSTSTSTTSGGSGNNGNGNGKGSDKVKDK